MAADIVNSLMIQYDSMTIEQNNFSTDQMLGFIDIRLYKLKGELDSLQNILLDYRQTNKLINVETQSGNSFEKISLMSSNMFVGSVIKLPLTYALP